MHCVIAAPSAAAAAVLLQRAQWRQALRAASQQHLADKHDLRPAFPGPTATRCCCFILAHFKHKKWSCIIVCFSESKEKFCVSIIDPARPAWYVRHYNYFLHVEPEYSPRNPHIFDNDASFFLVPDKFYPELFAFESVNYPNHYIQAVGSGKLRITRYVDREEFRTSASFVLTDHFIKRT